MQLEIGATVKIPVFNADGTEPADIDIEGVITGIYFGGAIVRVKLPTWPESETHEFLGQDILAWNKQA